MEKLYDKDEHLNDLGNELDMETNKAIRDIFEKYRAYGCSVREIEYTMNRAILDISLETLIGWGDPAPKITKALMVIDS